MRAVNFRDGVLYALAFKNGIAPRRLQQDRADSFASFINSWVRREWDALDFPEWTDINPFAPDANHIVPYSVLPIGPIDNVTSEISRTMRVYLVDPNTTSAPVDTPFTLRKNGVHVGYEHGSLVWIEFLPPAPRYTATPWKSDVTFNKGDPTYSERTGECYISLFNNNRGHDPVAVTDDHITFPPASELTQSFKTGEPGIPSQPLILDLYHIVKPEDFQIGGSFCEVSDATGIIADVVYTHQPGDDNVTIITALRNALASVPGLSTFTITLDTANLKITLENNSQFSVYGRAGYFNAFGVVTLDKITQIQAFNIGVASTSPTTQKTEITFTEAQLVQGANVTLTLVDPSGVEHTALYTVKETDSVSSLLAGLSAATSEAAVNDPYFQNVGTSVDNDTGKLTVESLPAAVSPNMTLPGSQYWKLQPFPLDLVEPVIRGVYADSLKSDGQIAKGMAEEQLAPTELQVRGATIEADEELPLIEQS